MVYCAGSLALAALELLVHIDYETALKDHLAIPASFTENLVLHVARESLPDDWMTVRGLLHTQALGDAWVDRRASAVLAVPSAVVPAEVNYLINPKHPDALNVHVGVPAPFRYDARLLKRPKP